MSVESGLDVVVKGRDELTPSLDGIQSKLIRFVGAVSSALAAVKIAAFPVDAIRDFEKELAGVQKTTGFTDSQLKKLGDGLIDLSRNINVSATDLAKIAAAAGQQGLGKYGVEGVRQFTESVSRMASVLDITVEQAGTDVGKIASIFKIPLKEIENAASAFNEVSNNSTASGEQLLDVVKRIGDAAGSLNLQQSIGLSATGIDLGLSPEVVGSSFQKVFAEMYARAGQFSKLLGVSVDDWIKGLQTNGIGALKQYLAGLRKLTPEAQQQTIKALSGGGRIGALVTKLLQDTEDTILDTNVANAVKGIETGTSAIKEQETVLKTLDAQIDKAGNSFKALGIIAGEEFAPRLASYFKQLNDALARPDVINFAKAVGRAFLDMFDTIAKGIHFLSDLNITWTNFVTVAKILIGIKLVSVFSGLLTTIPLVGALWSKLAGQAVAAGDAQAAAGGVGSKAVTSQVAQLQALIAKHAEYRKALADEATAAKVNAKAQDDLVKAQAAKAAANKALINAQIGVGLQGGGVTSAKAGVAAAETAATARTASVQSALNARLEAAEQAHAARLVAIEQERVRLQSIARDAGDRSALLAATRARNDQIAAENAFYTKSVAGIQAYYARRLTAAQEAGVAEVATAKAALAAQLSSFDGVVKNAGLAQLGAQADGAAAALARAEATAAGTATTLTLTQRAAAVAGAGFGALATGVRFAVAGFQALLSIASRLFIWLTIIYTILEATGALDKVGALFEKLTDAMGITSEAGRKLEEQHRKTIASQDDLKKSADAAAEAIERLGKLQDKDTGQLSDKSLKSFQIGLASKDRDAYLKTFDEVVQGAADAQTKIDSLQGSQGFSLIKVQDLEAQKTAVLAKIDELQTAYQNRIDRFGLSAKQGDFGSQRAIDEAKNALDQQQALVSDIGRQITELSGKNAESISQQIDKTKQDLTALQDLTTKTFTPESAQIFENFARPYLEAAQAKEDAEKAYNDAVKASDLALAEGKDEARRKELQDDVDAALAKQKATEAIRQQIRIGLAQDIEAIKKNGGLSEATVGSLEALTTFLDKGQDVIKSILNGIGLVRKAGGTFTGELAPPPKTAPEGVNTFKPLSDSEIRRQRKAQADLVRAGLEAEANLNKEHNSQLQDDNEYAYKQNTESLKTYYAERLKLQRANLDIELTLQRNQLANLKDELGQASTLSDRGKIDEKLKNPKLSEADRNALNAARDDAPSDDSDALRIQAQIVKAQGDVDRLQLQKSALEKDNNREYQDALRRFTENVNDQRAALTAYLGGGTDQEAYNLALTTAADKYKDFVDRLTVESKEMPELLPIIDEIKLQASLKAVEEVLDRVGKRSAIVSGYLDITASKITALGDAGLITRAQVATLEELNRKAIIAAGEADVKQKQDALNAMDALSGGAARSTQAYKELQLQIDEARNKVDLLKIQGEKVAADLDKEFNNNLSSALKSLRTNGGDFGAAIQDFFVGTLNTLADKAADSLADTLYKSLNSALTSVTDGAFKSFGSLFAPIFQSDPASALGAAGDALKTTDVAKDLLGTTPATPLYVTDAAAAVGGLGGAGADLAGGVGDAVAKVPDESFFSSTFDSLSSGIGDGLSSVGSLISSGAQATVSGIGSLGSSLLGFLGTLVNTIVAAISASAGSDAAGGLAGAAAGVAAAHGGGIAGRTTMTRYGVGGPNLFTDAVRYHTGGKAGLAPNEVPVILEKGEEVLTKQDPRHQDNLGKDGSASQGGGQTNFMVQPVLSEEAVLDAMKGTSGQKLLIVHIRRNPGPFRQALGIKS
jgi:TP901 family phage tail tape measure protein